MAASSRMADKGMTHQFKAIQRKTLSSEMVEQILSLIRTKELRLGDKLPSERELGRAFNVGRSSVREAIKILETTGLVRTTTRGKEISAAAPSGIPDFNLAADATNIREVFEARKMIEIELTALAAERASPEDIEAMHRAVATPGLSESATLAADIAFHRALVNSAHNSVLSEVYNSITGLLFQNFKYYVLLRATQGEDLKAHHRRITDDHLAIIAGIAAGNAAAAKRAMRTHLDHAESWLLAALDAQYRAGGEASPPTPADGRPDPMPAPQP
jgi:GntR family transcriptional regulator, transcriptional repressor for pyruvate dehydrogenase complex